MGYADYIRLLLSPIGIYDLSPASLSGGEAESIGEALDDCASALAAIERESVPATAEDDGLNAWESLFAHCPASPTTELRRAAIFALAAIGEGDFTPAAINRAIDGCGITAEAEETGERGTVRVTFPDTAGEPDNFGRIREIITDIIPCHLEIEFYFRYITWSELESKYATFADVDAADLTWLEFEKSY